VDYISKTDSKQEWANLIVQPSIRLHETSMSKE